MVALEKAVELMEREIPGFFVKLQPKRLRQKHTIKQL